MQQSSGVALPLPLSEDLEGLNLRCTGISVSIDLMYVNKSMLCIKILLYYCNKCYNNITLAGFCVLLNQQLS